MSGGQVEPNTDPRFIYADDSNVIAYRLGIVETDIKGLDVKLDRVINEYPNNGMIKLLLDPLREEVKDLKNKRAEDEANKIKDSQQIKYLLYAAIAGPVATFIITLVMAYILGDKNVK